MPHYVHMLTGIRSYSDQVTKEPLLALYGVTVVHEIRLASKQVTTSTRVDKLLEVMVK